MIKLISRTEAREAGLKLYFTGKPCPQGHIATRRVSGGTCSQCAIETAARHYAAKRSDAAFRAANNARALANYERKAAPKRKDRRQRLAEQIESAKRNFPEIKIRTREEAIERGLTRFFVGAKCRNGHVAERMVNDLSCLACKRAGTAQWREKSGGALHAYYAAYYVENAEKQKAKSRRKHAILADDPVYRAGNAARTRAWIKANPAKHKRNLHRRRAREVAAEGEFAPEDLARIRRAQRDRCAYCRKKLNGEGELDHIRPLVPRDGGKPGTNRPSNLQFLCRPCNRRKHTKDPIEFARASGLLL